MKIIKNIVLQGSNQLPIGLDIFYDNGLSKRKIVLYVHGFNGFKDWGDFDLVAYRFVEKGYTFIKFNFSHNGTSPESPEVFTNLEAFGQNNYTIELEDLKIVTDWICDNANPYNQVLDIDQIYLIGHSLGGGISILFANEDLRIKKLIGWATINECTTPWGNWPVSKLEEWKRTGVQYYANSRTGQQMPLYYQLYEDYIQHKERLDIRNAVIKLSIPVLICHGIQDTSVPVEKAKELIGWQPNIQFFMIESDHVFGRKHPWLIDQLPAAMESVLAVSLKFLAGNTY